MLSSRQQLNTPDLPTKALILLHISFQISAGFRKRRDLKCQGLVSQLNQTQELCPIYGDLHVGLWCTLISSCGTQGDYEAVEAGVTERGSLPLQADANGKAWPSWSGTQGVLLDFRSFCFQLSNFSEPLPVSVLSHTKPSQLSRF